MTSLIGTWNLVEWDCTIDGEFHNHPFGRDARGRLMYTPEGTMMAILMRENRPNFQTPNLVLGSDVEKESAIGGYVSYSGSYRVEDGRVIHSVEFSLLPNWIGTDLVRDMTWIDGELLLTSEPKITRSGRSVVNRLRWEKV